ncbi:putative transcriptional regulator, Crp/Fnr family [Paludibacter propionicigenes WB4]|uniref:Putative transcriptional regulator, Crp/Fnr family n=1 Tax=Paludibacter propionicigenes (strain DSM 17365 / JCM 13257 / WB4) TaxID=694427 RepID=E4T1L1_PALPW|nr:Crp/Fnr family transcriptional regulator [Paludibacter propionicigenes]ADQ78605.1 putative transcriptional regulator, Crp/Fnr family [Paludibacter propionicigenes WB4]
MERIFQLLSESMDLSSELKSDLADKICIRKVKKGEIIVNEGKICDQLFFIKKGALRGFHYHNGKDITSWFGFEDDFGTSTYSFITQTTGFEIVESIESGILYVISYNDLYSIYKKYPEFNYVGRILTEKYYIDLMERTLCLQYQSAKENYEQLVVNRPQILQRATLGHIASYLGISQETLSRIRTKK